MITKISKPIIGLGNYIEKNVNIFPGVKIGNNNKIYNGTIIYPGTVIGNNNVILNNNILGEHPIDSNEKQFTEKKHGGLILGDNNFLHISNKIYSGLANKTMIGDNNKILAESHIGHDTIIGNFVNIYTRTLLCGFVKMCDYSGTGVGTFVHQRKVIGDFSFTAMNSSIVRNSFPFFVNIDNKKYTKINYHQISLVPEFASIKEYESILTEMCNKYVNKNLDLSEYETKLPDNIFNIIKNFLANQ